MSVFDQEETRCNRENNACKLKYKCQRYLNISELNWVADYWQEFGRLCKDAGYFLPLPKDKVIVKGLPETKDDKGS